MHRRPTAWSAAADVCWRCQWRLALRPAPPTAAAGGRRSQRSQTAARAFRAAARPRAEVAAALSSTAAAVAATAPVPVRQQLQQWQQEHGGPDDAQLNAFENYTNRAMDVVNGLASMNGREDLKRTALQANAQEEQADDDAEDLITAGLFLKAGDVAVLDGLSSTLAVFVQNIGPHSQFVRADGQSVHTRLADVDFVIPGALDPALLQPLLPYLPTRVEKLDGASAADRIQIPRDLSAPISEFLDQLTASSERIYRENAAVLDSAYATLADRTRTRIMTRDQIVSLLLAPHAKNYVPSTAEVLALRKVIKYHPFGFYTDARVHRLTNVYHIRAKDDVEVIEQVHKWVRSYSEYCASTANTAPEERSAPPEAADCIFQFANTARKLIEISRQRRDPLFGTLGPDKIGGRDAMLRPKIKFSETDMKIINLLQAWTLSSGNSDDLYAAATVILAATECYTEALQVVHGSAADEAGRHKLTREWGYVLLQEIGVIRPYENRALYDEKLMLPTVRPSRNVDLLKTKAELVRKNPNFRDSVGSLRKDWDDLEVYCIDNADAKEIDDGISISRVDSRPSECWIHVHVANPTAFFDKTHVLSGLAAHMAESLYVPERTYSMLPSWVSEKFFSISDNRPVLTISARINESGTVLEKKIQPGIARRVTKLTYDELTRVLGETPEKAEHVTVGGKINSRTERDLPKLSSSQLRDLEALYDASRALYARRKAAGGFKLQYARTGCSVFNPSGQAGLDWVPPSVDRPLYTHGDPTIDLTYSPTMTVTARHQARHIVEEMMTLACSVAGDWCVDRNIPAIFRGTVAVPGQMYTVDELEAKLTPYGDNGEEVPPRLLSHWRRSQNALVHASAIPHGLLKTSSYTRVTSPLRRFSDMITHWQIEAALRYEARTGRRFDANKKDAAEALPFSTGQIRESILSITSRERAFSRTESAARRHWVMAAFTRALYYSQGTLPTPFRVTVQESDVVTKPGDTLLGEVHGFGIMVSVVPPADGQQMEPFDEWEVQPVDINVYRRAMTVQAVRLLRRVDGEGLEAPYKDMPAAG